MQLILFKELQAIHFLTMMIKFLMSLFRGKVKEQETVHVSLESKQDSDFIDYDGMGNQGRFPTSKNKKRERK